MLKAFLTAQATCRFGAGSQPLDGDRLAAIHAGGVSALAQSPERLADRPEFVGVALDVKNPRVHEDVVGCLVT